MEKTGGVIAAGGKETAVAGAAMLKQGGNAVDAAVAAAFASFIAEIGVVHLGGSGIAHLFHPQNGRSIVYDFFSNTPGLGQLPPDPIDFEKVTINFGPTTQDFYLGRASVAVPGNIFGLCQLLADHGRLPLKTVLEPALSLATTGVPLAPFQADTCRLLENLYTHTAGMQGIFAPNGRLLQSGDRLFIPHLAELLAELAVTGADLLRNGRLADALIRDQQQHHGLLTHQDLQSYQVRQVNSIRIPYRQFELLLPPYASTGGVLTAFTTKLLDGFDIARRTPGSPDHLQLLYEVMNATNLARPRWDKTFEQLTPDRMHIDEAIDDFLSAEHIAYYQEIVYDAIHKHQPSPAAPEPPAPNNTSHLSVIDADGLAVSLTTTAGESAGYVVPDTGFIPNNMMGEADLHPHGFHTQPPGQRITTMMTPTVILLNNQTRLVLGSGGSIRIRSAILQVMSNLLDFGMTLDESVNRCRVHIEDGALQCEAGFDETAVAELEKRGYRVNRWNVRSIYFGGAHSVSRTENGRLVAAGDSRRGGETAVV